MSSLDALTLYPVRLLFACDRCSYSLGPHVYLSMSAELTWKGHYQHEHGQSCDGQLRSLVRELA